MTIPPKTDSSQYNCNQQLHDILHKNRKKVLKLIWNHKKPKTSKLTQSRIFQFQKTDLPDFKLYYRTIVIKIAGIWPKNRYVNQRGREGSNVSSCNCSHLIFDKDVKNRQLIKIYILNNWLWEN